MSGMSTKPAKLTPSAVASHQLEFEATRATRMLVCFCPPPKLPAALSNMRAMHLLRASCSDHVTDSMTSAARVMTASPSLGSRKTAS